VANAAVNASNSRMPGLPGGAARIRLLQCSDCGGAIGVIDPDGRDQIEGLRRQIASIDLRLMQIAKMLAGLN
jgi:hypothetical protein